MFLSSNIILDSFPDSDETFYILLRRIFTAHSILSANDKRKISPKIELEVCRELIQLFKDDDLQIARSVEILLPKGRVYHYFIISGKGKVLDVFAWRYVELSYSEAEIFSESLVGRANPSTKNNEISLFSIENMPLILWSTVRAIFLKKRDLTRSYKKEIAQMYQEYQEADGTAPDKTISRIFAIAVRSLQKNKLLKEGTRQPSLKGRKRSNELETLWGLEGTRKRLKEFEEILRQGRKQ